MSENRSRKIDRHSNLGHVVLLQDGRKANIQANNFALRHPDLNTSMIVHFDWIDEEDELHCSLFRRL